MLRIKLEHIEPQHAIGTRRVKIDYVISSFVRNTTHDVSDVGAMRINHAHTMTLLDILSNHILHQSGLTSTGLTDDVEMTHAIFE